jgi:hypothetical protein
MRRCLVLTALLCGSTLIALPSSAEEAKKPASPERASAPGACQPKPGRNACGTCHEKECCAERRACEADPACAAFSECLRNSCATPPCHGNCGLPPAAFVARFACQMARCNREVCGGPVDDCTLCTTTRCAAATLACVNQPGCDEYSTCVVRCAQDSACQARCKRPTAAAITAAATKAQCVEKECRPICSTQPKQ